MQKIGKILDQLLQLIYRLFANVSAIIMLFITLLITAEILNRLIFNQSFQFIMQFSGYSLFIVTFLGAAYVLRDDSHITIDFVVERLPEKVRKINKIIMYIIGCGLCIFLLLQTWNYTADAWAKGMSTDYPIRVPLAYLLVLMPIGWLFMAIEFLVQVGRLIKDFGKKQYSDEEIDAYS